MVRSKQDAHHVAVLKGADVVQPRKPAKSVTVE
jgi:glucosamine 6-phosphate synthetase-like amidotransferase/phosphosugar isomerase protein